MRTTTLTLNALALSLALAPASHAETIKDQLTGAWTLLEGAEVKADGQKTVPWVKGSLIADKSGQMSFFVIAKDRPKTENVRMPSGQMVSWYGTYTVDEAGKGYTVKVEGASFVPFEGMARDAKVSFSGDTMTTMGSKVATPEGEITPVNVWKRVK